VFSFIIDGCLRTDNKHFEDLYPVLYQVEMLTGLGEDDSIEIENECLKAIQHIKVEKFAELF
jgi:hypothetical protein